MERIWLAIIRNRSNPVTWPPVILLWIFSIIYRLALLVRSLVLSRSVKLKTPVISVGNLALGGSGKTPLVIEIASHYMAQGKTVGIASIGYGRKDKAAHSGTGHGLTKLTASIIGDEVLMMAERLPEIFFAVAHTKTEAAKTLEEKYHPDIILVDDGFQHQSLHREVDLLLIDATLDLRREPLFPLGRRREPLKAIRRADLIILTRASQDSKVSIGWMKERYQMPIIPVTFENSKIIDEQGLIPLEKLQNCPVYIFAGIGNFAAFKRGLESRLRNIRYFRQFHDHCRYDEPQRALIKKDVGQFSPEFVITTHKDYVKLRGFDFGRPVYYLDMEVSFQPNRDVFYKFIGETLLRKYGKKI